VAGFGGRMSAMRDLGFHQVLEPAEVRGDEPLKLAQQAQGQPERAAGSGPRAMIARASSAGIGGPSTGWPVWPAMLFMAA
jgi:hypothetical protein